MPIANQANVPASVIGMIPPMSNSDHARSPIEIAASDGEHDEVGVQPPGARAAARQAASGEGESGSSA